MYPNPSPLSAHGVLRVSSASEPLTLHPTQFQDIWSGRCERPELQLAAAVLEGAVIDLLKYRYARGRGRQRKYWQAYQWIASTDREWPYSFVNICDHLGLSTGEVRAFLLNLRGAEVDAQAA